MNPLDNDEFEIFIEQMNRDMPLHTETSAKIKLNYSSCMPKSAVDLSQKVDNEFLNDNLHIIEEMEYRQKGITDNFRNYQNKQYGKSDILNHDLYFEHDGKIIAKVSGAQPFIMNPSRFSAPCTHGTELSNGNTAAHSTGNHNYFFACQVTGGASDLCYDEISVNCFDGTGDWVLGAYTNVTGTPTTKIEQISAITTFNTSFNYVSIPEFTNTSTLMWLATNQSNISGQFYYNNAGGLSGKYGVLTYNSTMPASAPTVGAGAQDVINMKVTHT